MYHGNALVKDFQGIETTRESIEKVKMSKDIINRTGMPTTVYISDTEVKITIFGGQEPLHQHEVLFVVDKYRQSLTIFSSDWEAAITLWSSHRGTCSLSGPEENKLVQLKANNKKETN